MQSATQDERLQARHVVAEAALAHAVRRLRMLLHHQQQKTPPNRNNLDSNGGASPRVRRIMSVAGDPPRTERPHPLRSPQDVSLEYLLPATAECARACR